MISKKWPCPWRAGALALVVAALVGVLPAQIVASASVGGPSHDNPHFNTASVQARLGIALPSAPHLLLMWNFAEVGVDRLAGQAGASVATSVEAWVSPVAHPALSHTPLVLAEAGVGRRWGQGLHGFTVLGVGAGWSLGEWIPFAEYRRRASFHPGRPSDHEVLLGVKFILFG